MLEFGDSNYYIDINAFEKAIVIKKDANEVLVETEEKITLGMNNEVITTEKFTRSIPKVIEIDSTKYDLLKTFIDYIIDAEDVSDDTLGADRALAQTSFAYKLAFNTLEKENIIKTK
jgi:hypothetical protein